MIPIDAAGIILPQLPAPAIDHYLFPVPGIDYFDIFVKIEIYFGIRVKVRNILAQRNAEYPAALGAAFLTVFVSHGSDLIPEHLSGFRTTL